MKSDKNKSRLPSPVTEGSEVLSAAGIFPRSNSIQLDEKIAIARNEGFDPLAIELSIGSYETSAAQKWLQLGLVMIAAVLVAFLFPFDRFFKPRAQELGMMTIGDPVSGNMSEFGQPWLKALLEMDQLYFSEGKLTEAIQVAERNLAQVPQKDWESWQKVHYRYWELLADAGKSQSLEAATRSYLENLPEDPFANYYAAHAFLATVEPMRSFTSDMRQDFRLEAEALDQQIERAGKALKARQKAEYTSEQKASLQNLYPKLRLQQARLFVLIWRLGGYREDKHPDVVYRDKALDILEQDELVNLKEAKVLKIAIYNHILDRWHWFEGQQVIQGMKQNRKAMVAELKMLQQELKVAKSP
jgi:tetratricopeptide (TPR) repeat protein